MVVCKVKVDTGVSVCWRLFVIINFNHNRLSSGSVTVPNQLILFSAGAELLKTRSYKFYRWGLALSVFHWLNDVRSAIRHSPGSRDQKPLKKILRCDIGSILFAVFTARSRVGSTEVHIIYRHWRKCSTESNSAAAKHFTPGSVGNKGLGIRAQWLHADVDDWRSSVSGQIALYRLERSHYTTRCLLHFWSRVDMFCLLLEVIVNRPACYPGGPDCNYRLLTGQKVAICKHGGKNEHYQVFRSKSLNITGRVESVL